MTEIVQSDREDEQEHLVERVKVDLSQLKLQLGACESQNDRLILEREHEDHNENTLWIGSIMERYNEIANEARIFISKYERKIDSSDSSRTVNTLEATDKRAIHLEKLKFQVFDGQIRRYPKFKEEFMKHIKPQYQRDKEAFALRAYLSEEVREEISYLGDDIEQIWRRLDSKYGREGKLIDLIMNEVKQLQICRDDSPELTLSLINVVEKAYYDLKALGRESEVSNSAMVALIEEKLPTEIGREWEKMVTDESELNIERDKFPNLLKLLGQFKHRLEYRLSDIRQIPRVKGGVHFGDTTNNRDERPMQMSRRPWCWLHPDRDDHPIWRCEEFAAKSAKERLELVRNHEACFRCLDQGHKTSVCRRNFFCKTNSCGAPHHHLLHESYTSGDIFHGLNAATTMNNGEEIEVLLMLQKIKGVKGKALNVLWDGGSTVTLITFTAAKLQGLQRKQDVRLQIVKIGGKMEELDSYVYEMDLNDRNGQKVTIKALGIDKISNDIVEIDVMGIQRLFWDIDMKTIDRPRNGEIDCLIGLDYAGYHPVRQKASDHLLLMKNRFGYVIGGAHSKIKESSKKIVHHVIAMYAKIETQHLESVKEIIKDKAAATLFVDSTVTINSSRPVSVTPQKELSSDERDGVVVTEFSAGNTNDSRVVSTAPGICKQTSDNHVTSSHDPQIGIEISLRPADMFSDALLRASEPAYKTIADLDDKDTRKSHPTKFEKLEESRTVFDESHTPLTDTFSSNLSFTVAKMEESVSSTNYAADLSTKNIRKPDNLIPIKSNTMDMINCFERFRTELGFRRNHQLGRLILTPLLRLVFLGVAECFGSTRDLTRVRMSEAHVEELD